MCVGAAARPLGDRQGRQAAIKQCHKGDEKRRACGRVRGESNPSQSIFHLGPGKRLVAKCATPHPISHLYPPHTHTCLTYLVLNAGLVQVVPADGAGVRADGPGPHGDRIPLFDYYRQFYVAFSRAMDLLVVFWSGDEANKVFRKVLYGLPELDETITNHLSNENMKVSKTLPRKPEYSLTGDIHVYDVCPRQYMFLNKFEYAPSLSAQFQFGTLVHRTIEDIHNHVLKRKEIPTVGQIDYYFERNSRGLQKHGRHPIAPIFIEMARKQVEDYVADSGDSLYDVLKAEVSVVVQKKDYVLTGVVDLIKGRDGQPELLDFKASRRAKGQEYIDKYRLQLALYAKMIETKLGIIPVRFNIYWTAEENASARVQELDINKSDLRAAEMHFEEVVGRIESGNFRVVKKPGRDTCRNCDFRFGCGSCSVIAGRV